MPSRQKRTAGMLLALTILASGAGLLISAQSPQQVGTWAPTGAIGDGRTGAAAAALSDGTTLIVAGATNGTPTTSVLRYDPATNAAVAAGELLAARVGHTATALDNGYVLVIGGRVGDTPSGDIELFDPASGTSVLLAQLSQPRSGHAAARISAGIVLVFGGANADGVVLDSVERVNVSTGIVSVEPGRMLQARTSASATMLIDGRVLVAGGNNGSADLRSAELYIASSQVFESTTNELSVARSGHSAVLLPHNGGVLIAGGTSAGEAQATADLFLPAESPDPFSYGLNTFVATAPMSGARVGAFAGPGREGYAWVEGGGAADAESYRFATIKTDKDDYAPGETAVITGTGWVPGEEVRLLFQEYPAVHEDYELTVTADAAGNIYWDQWAPEQHDIGVRFYLLASDSRSRAQTTFTDGNLSSTIAFNITPASAVTPGATLNWTVNAQCVDGGGPNTCTSEGYTHNGPVQNGYTVEIQRATNAGFGGTVTTVATVSTVGGLAAGSTIAPSSGGPYFYRARHANQDLPNVPVQGSTPNSWQPQNSNTVQVTLLLDGTAPTTTLTVGTPKFGAADRFVTSATQFTLSCADNPGGTDCAATFYQIVAAAAACPSNGNEVLWNAYSGAFTLPAPDGEVRVCYFSRDTAGNRESPKFQNHVLDTAAPETTATATANAASYTSNAWSRFNVSVNLSAADGAAQAGVKEITYAASGATTIPSTTVSGSSVTGLVFSAEGTTTLTYFATDNVGNVESTTAFTIKIDKTAPTIADLGPTTSPNMAGWYKTDVTNRFRAADALSGLDAACLSLFPDDAGERIQSKTTSGEGEAVTVMSDGCTDEAGNTAAAVASAEFKIDKTAPVIEQVGFSPAANAAGWHNTNVTVRFKVTESLSGLDASCQTAFPAEAGGRIQSKVITAEGNPVTVASDGCTDVAGNAALPVTSTPFKIDKTKPTIVQHDFSPAANAAGWHNTNVTVRFRATDALSGLVGTCAAFPDVSGERIQSKTIEAEGNAVTVTSDDCTDVAGNTREGISSAEFKIDKTKPAIVNLGATTSPNANGWYNTNVINRFKATDTLSGLDSACLAIFVADGADRIQSKATVGEGEAVMVTSGSCADVAGNTTDAVSGGPFKIDQTIPLIVNLGPTTPPNGFDWYNTDVTNRFKVGDALSGIDVACQAAFPLAGADRVQSKTTAGEGVAISVASDACADLAGNVAASISSAAFKIDKTAPLVAIASPVSGSTIVLSIAANGTAGDTLSGVRSVTINGVNAVYNVGTGTWTASNVNLVCGPNTLTAVATDYADLSSAASVTITRLCFTFEYLRPLEQSYAGGLTVVNDGKYGRIIPVKGIVRRSGTIQTEADLAALGLTLRIGINAVLCSGGAATDSVEEYADAGLSNGGTNIFRWTFDGFFIYNLDTKTPPGVPMAINNCYRLDTYVQDAALNKVKVSESPYAIFKPVK